MYYTYIVKSLSRNTLYVGNSENPEKRLESEHNKGRVKYTKGRAPWVLVYKEKFYTRTEAVRQERFLKTGRGREYLKKFLIEAAGSSNGRTSDSESDNLGSNPSPAAQLLTYKFNCSSIISTYFFWFFYNYNEAVKWTS